MWEGLVRAGVPKDEATRRVNMARTWEDLVASGADHEDATRQVRGLGDRASAMRASRTAPEAAAPPAVSVPEPAAASSTEVAVEPIRQPRQAAIRPLPPPTRLQRLAGALMGTALAESPLTQRLRGTPLDAPAMSLESQRQRTERLASRVEAGNLVEMEPDEIQPDLLSVESVGSMAGPFFDPAQLSTMTAPTVAGERVAATVLAAAARRGVPGASRLLALGSAPVDASLARRVGAGLARAGGAGAAGMPALTIQETLGREGRLPTPLELVTSSAAGAALTAPFGAAGALLRRAPRVRAARDVPAVAETPLDVRPVPERAAEDAAILEAAQAQEAAVAATRPEPVSVPRQRVTPTEPLPPEEVPDFIRAPESRVEPRAPEPTAPPVPRAKAEPPAVPPRTPAERPEGVTATQWRRLRTLSDDELRAEYEMRNAERERLARYAERAQKPRRRAAGPTEQAGSRFAGIQAAQQQAVMMQMERVAESRGIRLAPSEEDMAARIAAADDRARRAAQARKPIDEGFNPDEIERLPSDLPVDEADVEAAMGLARSYGESGRPARPAKRPEPGAPADDAAHQTNLLGGDDLVGREQTELLPPSAGVPTARMRAGKIRPEETRRLNAERGGAEPPGQRPLDLELQSPATQGFVAKLRRLVLSRAPTVADAARTRSLIDISRGLADAVGVPLRQGRFEAARKGVAGVFKTKQEVTRVVRFDALDTVSHEVGHYISKHYLRNPSRSGAAGRGAAPLPKTALRELVRMGRDLYGSRKPNGGYGEEGIAEWASFYVTEPATIQTKAPTFSAWMDGVLTREPMLRAALDQARDDFARWQASPPNARVAAMLSVNERVRNLPTVSGIMRTVFDDLYEFRKAVRDLGGAHSASEDAYVLARLTRGAAGAAEEMLERGVTKYGTFDRAAPSFVETLRKVPSERMQSLREYLVAESALERIENGIDPGIVRGDALAIIKAGQKEFGDVARVLWDHGRALIDMRRDAGLLTDAEATLIKSKNTRRVPFYRVFDPQETGSSRGFGRGFGRNASGVKRQKGSARRIIDPLEGIIKDTYETVAQVRRHEVAREMVKLARATEGGGRIIEEVPAPQEVLRIPAEQLESQLADLGLVYRGVDAKTGKPFVAELGGPGGHELEGLLTAFRDARQAGAAESKDLVVPMLEGGERHWYAIRDRNLFDAMQGLGTPEMSTLVRWLSVPTRTLRAGATLTLEFIGRNPVRDAWSSAVFSRAGTRPPGYRLAEGLFHALKGDEVFQRWKLGGGDNAAMLGLDRPTVQSDLKRLMATGTTRGKLEYVVRHPIDALRMVSSLMENASRVGEFAGVEREAARRGASTLNAATEGTIAARDVSLDFAQSGTVTRHANQIVAFLTSYTRGQVQLLRELKVRPATILARAGAWITLPSLALYALQKDDPAYKNVPRWKRNVGWVIVDRGDDQGEGWDGYGSGKVERVWVIPKPFELGVLFGTVPERIAEYLDSNDSQSVDAMRDALARAFTPPHVPTAIVPLMENWANRSTFTDRPIVPRGRANLDPAEQVAERTGETARVAGAAVGYSPAKLENLARGYTGGLGRYALNASDLAVRTGRALAGMPPLRRPREVEADVLTTTPGIRGFATRPPGTDAESIERLYQSFAAAEQSRRTWRAMMAEGRADEAARYLEQHRAGIESVATEEETGGDPGPLRTAYNQIQALQRFRRGPLDEATARQVSQIMQQLGNMSRDRQIAGVRP